MSLFSGMKRSDDIKESSGFSLETDVYDAIIKMAWVGKSAGGAQFINFEFTLANGNSYREIIYVSSGDAKNNKNYYEKNGNKYYLPGFIIADELAALATGQLLADQEGEEKTIRVYDGELKEEVNKEVPVLTDMIGKKVKLGIQQSLKFKQAKDPSTGKWEDTDEKTEKNEISKVYSEDGFSMKELLAKAETPVDMDKWLERNKGEVRDQTKGKKGKTPAGSGSGMPPAPKKSLFNK